MAELVAKTYSKALFEVGIDYNSLDLYLEELKAIGNILKEHPDFYELLKTPNISTDDKKKIFDDVFKDKISIEVINFIKIILDKRRTKDLFSIIIELENLVYEHKGIVRATAYTTIPLGEEEKKSLQMKLESITNNKVELKNQIDKDLLGGVMIKLGDKVIDGTLRGKLIKLQKNLKEIIV